MLDYKDIIIKHYELGLSGSVISKQLGVSKSGFNDFIRAFEPCNKIYVNNRRCLRASSREAVITLDSKKLEEITARLREMRLPVMANQIVTMYEAS